MGNVKQHLEVAADGLIGPTSRSYWVVEGRLMAGAYPGKKDTGETGGRPEVTQQLLDAGTDVFVNLTEDLPGGGDRLDRYDEHVVGFMIYELHKSRLHILNFAVHPDCRRQDVGGQMIAKLVSKLSHQRRNRITLEVRETNLEAQLFFRDHNFLATLVLHNFYDDTPEDAYLMEYQYQPEPAEMFVPVNRIRRLAG